MLNGLDLALRRPAPKADAPGKLLGTSPGGAVSSGSSRSRQDAGLVLGLHGSEPGLPAVVAGRWRRLARLGQGAHGQVWAGQCLASGAPVALKFARGARHERLLRREAVVLQALARERHVARLLAVHEEGGITCLVLDRSGPSLAAWRREQPDRRLPQGEAARVGLQLLHALQAVHRHGYVHGDVKNANCVVTTSIDGPVCSLVDFGLARRPRGLSALVPGLIGTARYASVAVHGGLRPRAVDDLWSWFYSVAELLGGDLPWHRLTDASALVASKLAHRGGLWLQTLPPPFQQVQAALIEAETGDLPYTLLQDALRATRSPTEGP